MSQREVTPLPSLETNEPPWSAVFDLAGRLWCVQPCPEEPVLVFEPRGDSPNLTVCKIYYLFLWSWAGGILRILQSDWFRERAVFSYRLTMVLVTNYAKCRVKLRIERAKFQFVLIDFCNRAVLLFNFLIKKTMDSGESYHSESEFYYPNEEDKENNAVRLYFRIII